MCAEINVILIRLSSYSSDFNSIEISFSVLKTWIKRNDQLTKKYTKEMNEFEQFLRDAMKAQNTRDDADRLFRLTGIQYSTR